MDGIMAKAGHNGNFLGAWSDKFFEKKLSNKSIDENLTQENTGHGGTNSTENKAS